MAANYWSSTQKRFWTFSKDDLAARRQALENSDPALVQMYQLPSQRHLGIFFNSQINRLGKRLGVRQQPMATAQSYIKRFYTKVDMRRTNPYLVIATALYLACKMEECPQHIRLIMTESRALWPDFLGLSDTAKLGECEFFLISELSSQMIIHQPYRTLTQLQGEFGLSTEESRFAWEIINDHYMTDLPLLYAPHIIALTAILLSLVLKNGANASSTASSMTAATAVLAQGGRFAGAYASIAGGGGANKDGNSPGTNRGAKVQRLALWLAEGNVDIESMVDCTQELIAFYETQDQYNDKITRDQINRYVKARGLDK